MSARSMRIPPGPCAKLFLAVFGSLFLIALLAVPVTTKTSQLRQDRESNIVVRTTYPKNSTMFLPHYMAVRARSSDDANVHVRSTQWVGTMAIVAVLGFFDYFVFCRLIRRRRRVRAEEP